MPARKWIMLLINLAGGAAVLGSYIFGILTHPQAGQVLWSGVPEKIRPFYSVNMLLAAAGYFAFTYFLLFRLDPKLATIASRFGFGLFNAIYAIILIPSALWMPLTVLAVEQSSLVFLWLVRLVLWIVAAASLGLLLALLNVEPRWPRWAYALAIAGIIAFCLQTALLDSIVWVIFFQV